MINAISVVEKKAAKQNGALFKKYFAIHQIHVFEDSGNQFLLKFL